MRQDRLLCPPPRLTAKPRDTRTTDEPRRRSACLAEIFMFLPFGSSQRPGPSATQQMAVMRAHGGGRRYDQKGCRGRPVPAAHGRGYSEDRRDSHAGLRGGGDRGEPRRGPGTVREGGCTGGRDVPDRQDPRGAGPQTRGQCTARGPALRPGRGRGVRLRDRREEGLRRNRRHGAQRAGTRRGRHPAGTAGGRGPHGPPGGRPGEHPLLHAQRVPGRPPGGGGGREPLRRGAQPHAQARHGRRVHRGGGAKRHPHGRADRRQPGEAPGAPLHLHGHLRHQPVQAGRQLRAADPGGRAGRNPGGGAGGAPVRGHGADHPGREPRGAGGGHPGRGHAHPDGQPRHPGALRQRGVHHRPAGHEIPERGRGDGAPERGGSPDGPVLPAPLLRHGRHVRRQGERRPGGLRVGHHGPARGPGRREPHPRRGGFPGVLPHRLVRQAGDRQRDPGDGDARGGGNPGGRGNPGL